MGRDRVEAEMSFMLYTRIIPEANIKGVNATIYAKTFITVKTINYNI